MSNYKLKFSTKFKKDFKKVSKEQKLLRAAKEVFNILIEEGTNGIPQSLKPHQLKGNYKNHWECYIKPDLLLIWFQLDEEKKEITLARIGSHSDLFK